MRVGGIQRSLHNLLTVIAEDERFEDVYVDVFISDDKDAFYQIPKSERISVIYTQKLPYWNRFIPFDIAKSVFASKCKVTDKEYDLAIDFNSYWNECAIGAILANAKKRVCWIHNDVEIKKNEEWKYSVLHFFFKDKYRYFDSMVAVSEGVVAPFYKVNKSLICECSVIGNLVNTELIQEKLSNAAHAEIAEDRKKELISVGRLCHQKGYDLLIGEIKGLVNERNYTDFHLTIVGDGPDRETLQELVKHSQLSGYVNFVGNQDNPYEYMAAADAMVMCSRYEGQGIVFWEAKALGLPVIIPEHLEKYTGGIDGSADLQQAIIDIPKRNIAADDRYKVDKLTEYNNKVIEGFKNLYG